MAANQPINQVPRRIHFFRLYTGVANGQPVPIDVDALIHHIDAIPLGPQRYVNYGLDRLMMIVDWAEPHQRVQLVRSRDTDVPQKELAGHLNPVDLDPGEGIAEVTHVVFFPNRTIGVEFNFYGPRGAALAYYLEQMAPNLCPPVSAKPLVRQDLMNALEEGAQIKVLEMRVHRDYIPQLADVDDDLSETFRHADEIGDAEEFTLVLQPKLHSRGEQLGQHLKGIVQTLLGRDDVTDGLDRFRVTTLGVPGHPSREIDLLLEKLIYDSTVVKLNATSRAVLSTSAYQAIQEAWEQHGDEIGHAQILV